MTDTLGTRIWYKHYLIEPYEAEPGLWRARVRRMDRQNIKIPPDGREYPFIETRGMERGTKDHAIQAGKDLIRKIEKGRMN